MKKFTRAVSENTDCSFAYDLEHGKILFISPDIERITGYAMESFHQSDDLFFSVFDPLNSGEFKTYVTHLPENQRLQTSTSIITAAFVSKNVNIKLDVKGNEGRRTLYGIIREDNAVATEDQLRRNGEKLETLIEGFTDYFFILNRQWEFIEVNSAFERTVNRKRELLLGKVIWNEFPDILGTDFEKVYRKALKGRKPVEFTSYFSPRKKWFNTTVYPSNDELTIFGKDVSAEILAAEELVWTKTNLEALINTTEDMIWSIDKQMNYVYMNKAFCSAIEQITNGTVHEGGHVFKNYNYSDDFVTDWSSFYNKGLSGERYTIIYDIESKREGVGLLSFAISFNPIKNVKGDITGLGCFGKNITQQLKAEKAMLAQNNKLKNIAALTSHEIRGPVASLLGLIHVLDRKNMANPDNHEIIELIFEAGNEIDAVIKQIVDNAFTGYFPE